MKQNSTGERKYNNKTSCDIARCTEIGTDVGRFREKEVVKYVMILLVYKEQKWVAKMFDKINARLIKRSGKITRGIVRIIKFRNVWKVENIQGEMERGGI